MKKLIILTFVILSSFFLALNAYSNFPEFFGSNILNSSLGGQGSFSEKNSGNNYYHPAVLAFSKDINVSTALTLVAHNFEDINNIVIKNPTNDPSAGSSGVLGSVNTNYDSVQHASINASLPVKDYGSLGFSLFLPVGKIMETNSGDSYLPEYVLYRARYKRIVSHLNYAHKLNNDFAFSLGIHMGFQAGANVNTNASLNGTSYGSSANAKTEANPTLAGVASLAYRTGESQFTATFQQEMKNNLESAATGLTAVPPVPFDITISSMIYYDPHILRVAYQRKLPFGELALSTEYQIWDNYKTPIVRIRRNSGTILPSDDYERVVVQNILVPKAGMTFNFGDSFDLALGAKYKPSIFAHTYNNAGNSVDLNSLILSGGALFRMNLFGTNVELGGNAQYHMLQQENVVKSANLENGSAGSKIGAPGYTIGGNVTVLSLGLNVEL